MNAPESGGESSVREDPIILIPGIGPGVPMYLTLLRTIMHATGAPIFILEAPHIHMKAPWSEGWGEVMEEHEFQLNFRNMLLAHGYTTDVRPTVVAHSYGCFLAKWLLHRNPYIKLRGAVLTDPLVFMPVFPEVSYNICHKKPKTPYEHLVKVLLKEPGIAKAFHRHSFWSDVCLWDADLKEDTHAKVAVLLSKKDTFLPAQKVFEYLKHSAVIPRDRFYVQMLPGHHGEFMLHPRQLDHVCRMLTFVQWQDGASGGGGGGRTPTAS